MRILYANNNYMKDCDGAAKSTQLLAENMAKRGHEVAVFCVNNVNRTLDVETHNEVKVFRGHGGIRDFNKVINGKVAGIESLFYQALTVYNPTISSQFKHIISQFKPDILHTNSITGSSLLIWAIAKKNSIRVLHTQRDYSMYNPSIIVGKMNKVSMLEKAPLKLYRSICRFMSQKVDYITSPSEYTLSIFKNNNYFSKARKWDCIPNSIVYNEDEFLKNMNLRRRKKEDCFTFLFAGSLIPKKGIRQLVDTFCSIDNPNIKLLICGSGILKDYIIKIANVDNRVVYKGVCNEQELSMVYRQADCIVVPSLWEETFGRVIIEANYFGLPAIVSKRGGMPEIIEQMKSGFVYDPDKESALKNTMLNIIGCKDIQYFFNNIEKNMHKYSIDYQIDMFEGLYRELLQQKM